MNSPFSFEGEGGRGDEGRGKDQMSLLYKKKRFLTKFRMTKWGSLWTVPTVTRDRWKSLLLHFSHAIIFYFFSMEIEPACYRISIKALISNEAWDLLLVKEKTGVWDFPGWWLDHGERYDTCLRREIGEEMWCEIIAISPLPKYFITAYKEESKTRPWIANVFYEVEVKDLHFTPSNECSEIWFFDI